MPEVWVVSVQDEEAVRDREGSVVEAAAWWDGGGWVACQQAAERGEDLFLGGALGEGGVVAEVAWWWS